MLQLFGSTCVSALVEHTVSTTFEEEVADHGDVTQTTTKASQVVVELPISSDQDARQHLDETQAKATIDQINVDLTDNYEHRDTYLPAISIAQESHLSPHSSFGSADTNALIDQNGQVITSSRTGDNKVETSTGTTSQGAAIKACQFAALTAAQASDFPSSEPVHSATTYHQAEDTSSSDLQEESIRHADNGLHDAKLVVLDITAEKSTSTTNVVVTDPATKSCQPTAKEHHEDDLLPYKSSKGTFHKDDLAIATERPGYSPKSIEGVSSTLDQVAIPEARQIATSTPIQLPESIGMEPSQPTTAYPQQQYTISGELNSECSVILANYYLENYSELLISVAERSISTINVATTMPKSSSSGGVKTDANMHTVEVLHEPELHSPKITTADSVSTIRVIDTKSNGLSHQDSGEQTLKQEADAHAVGNAEDLHMAIEKGCVAQFPSTTTSDNVKDSMLLSHAEVDQSPPIPLKDISAVDSASDVRGDKEGHKDTASAMERSPVTAKKTPLDTRQSSDDTQEPAHLASSPPETLNRVTVDGLVVAVHEEEDGK